GVDVVLRPEEVQKLLAERTAVREEGQIGEEHRRLLRVKARQRPLAAVDAEASEHIDVPALKQHDPANLCRSRRRPDSASLRNAATYPGFYEALLPGRR